MDASAGRVQKRHIIWWRFQSGKSRRNNASGMERKSDADVPRQQEAVKE